MSSGEHHSEWLQLVRDMSTRRKSQAKTLEEDFTIRGREEANSLDGGGPAGAYLEAVEQGRKPFGPGLV